MDKGLAMITASMVKKRLLGAFCYTEGMKVLVLYRPNSEHGRIVEDFIHNLQNRVDRLRLEVLNIDSRDGSAMASLYDIMSHPAVLVVQDDGYVQKSWIGEQLPLADEVIGYARA